MPILLMQCAKDQKMHVNETVEAVGEICHLSVKSRFSENPFNYVFSHFCGILATGPALKVRALDYEAEGGDGAVHMGEDDLLRASTGIGNHSACLPSLLSIRQHLNPVAGGVERLAKVQANP